LYRRTRVFLKKKERGWNFSVQMKSCTERERERERESLALYIVGVKNGWNGGSSSSEDVKDVDHQSGAEGIVVGPLGLTRRPSNISPGVRHVRVI